ncbi:MAG: ABC transporter ATP-binding protein [Desulfobacteraceae bacterium]|nr:MAG: ABC transporter ATP-binding protein [Desulfobacteraceae bacterium]
METKDPKPVISARSLSRIYPLGDRKVVGICRVDLTIPAGELVVLKGNSGSGKSTLLSLLAGLDRATEGDLNVSGFDLNKSDAAALTRFRREVIGMVFQTFNLLPTLNVLENVCLPALLAGRSFSTTRRKAQDLLSWLALSDRLDHLPAQLSGGEMQRTAIARALINDPAVILADEPTGNLDSRNGRRVIELLAELNRKWGRTVMIATHSDLADPFSTLTIRLEDGRVANDPCRL